MSQQKRKTNKNKKGSRTARSTASGNRTRSTGGSGRSGAAKSSAAGSRNGSQAAEPQRAQGGEVLLILLAAVCVLLLLGNLDLAGRLGQKLREIQLGLFGVLGYFFPFYLFWAGCFAYANGKEHPGNTTLKLIASAVALIAACGLAELLGGRGLVQRMTLAECYAYGADGLNGGWFGGLFYLGLYPVFGVLGTYVVLIVFLIIGVVVTTGKSVIQPLQERGGRMIEKKRQRSERRREEAALRREEEAVRREEEALARQEQYRQLELRRTELHAKSLAFGEETSLTGDSGEKAPVSILSAGKNESGDSAGNPEKNAGSSSSQGLSGKEKPFGFGAGKAGKKRSGVTAEEIAREDPENDDSEKYVPRKVHSTLAELDAMDRGEMADSDADSENISGPVIHISGEENGWSRPGLDGDAGSVSAEWSRPVHIGGASDAAPDGGGTAGKASAGGENAVKKTESGGSAEEIPPAGDSRAPEPMIFTGGSEMPRLKERPEQRQITPDLLGGGGNNGPVLPEGPYTADSGRPSGEPDDRSGGRHAGEDGMPGYHTAFRNAEQTEAAGKAERPEAAERKEQTEAAGGAEHPEAAESEKHTKITGNAERPEAAGSAVKQEEDDGMSAYDEFDDSPSEWELAMNGIGKPGAGSSRSKSGQMSGGDGIWRTGGLKDGNSGVTFGARKSAGKAGVAGAAAAGSAVSGHAAGAAGSAAGASGSAAGAAAAVSAAVNRSEERQKKHREYRLPSTDLLNPSRPAGGADAQQLRDTANKLQKTLDDFGVSVTVTEVSQGPSVTRYELHPAQGVKVSRITSLQDDIKLSLAVPDIRIEAPIPGKAAVGIEVPNKVSQTVAIADIIESREFRKASSKITFGVGKGISGNVVVADLARMPHLLIAGATGSGKSVCINSIIMSILYKAKPDEVKLILIDPKMVELSVYNGIPHLMIPVVTDPKKASAALNWAVSEMSSRYQKFADEQVRDIRGYNQKTAEDPEKQRMPQIVVIVDEMADLMMVAGSEVEDSICRLAQLARAAGIHLVLATQRPSVNVITGLIKANVQSRIAFAVSSGVDSRTILDMNGAEKLLGKGDMLFYPSNYPKPVRVQGAFVSDEEVERVVDFWKEQADGDTTDEEVEQKIEASAGEGAAPGLSDRDELFADAGRFIIEKDRASIGNLQRAFRIGFNRAARIMDQLADCGVVGPDEGTKAREILMDRNQFEELLQQLG